MIKKMITCFLALYGFGSYADVEMQVWSINGESRNYRFLKEKNDTEASIIYKLSKEKIYTQKKQILCFGRGSGASHFSSEPSKRSILPNLFHIKHDLFKIKGDLLQRKNIKKEKQEIDGAKVDFIFKD